MIDVLETCVPYKALLARCLPALQITTQECVPHNGFLTIDRADYLTTEGLAVVDDRNIVKLAVNPVSMWTLHDAIYENFSERWANRVMEADEAILKLGDDTHELPKSSRSGFPWEKLHLVSHESINSLLRGNAISPISVSGHKTTMSGMRSAVSEERPKSRAQSTMPAQPTGHRERLKPNDHGVVALAVVTIEGSPYTLSWNGKSYHVLTDENDRVYVHAPKDATHLKVGKAGLFLLNDIKTVSRTSGRKATNRRTKRVFLVSRLTGSELRLRVEKGQKVTFCLDRR